MEFDKKPYKTHIRVSQESLKNKIKSYPRCYYVPINDDSDNSIEVSRKVENSEREKQVKDYNVDSNTSNEIKTNKAINSDLKEYKEFKIKEEKKKKKELPYIASPTLSSDTEENRENIHKQEYKTQNNMFDKDLYNQEINKNKIISTSEDSLNSSPNLYTSNRISKSTENYKNKRLTNFESMDESNSDYSNYNYSSSNITFKSNTLDEGNIRRKRELSKSLESLFDDEIKSTSNSVTKEKEKEKEIKRKVKEKKLEKFSNDLSKYSGESDNDNEQVSINKNYINSAKEKGLKAKKKIINDSEIDEDIEITDENNKVKYGQNIKKEIEQEENIFKKKKLKKEKKILKGDNERVDEEKKLTEEDIKNMNDEERERRLQIMKKKLHKELFEKESDKDQDSSFESKDKIKHVKSSSSLSTYLQSESASFIKMAKQVFKKKKKGEELTKEELAIYNKIQKKRKLDKTENSESRKLQKLNKTKKDNRYISSYASKPCISAEKVITDLSIYEEFGNPENKKVKQGRYETIKLLYPNGKYESYPLITPKKSNELDPIYDIYATTQMVIRYCVPLKYQKLFGDTKNGIIRSIIKARNRKNKEGLKKAITEYNKTLEFIINEKAFVNSEEFGDVSAPELVFHILEQAYTRTVAQKSEMLNLYRGFSNNVYGEVNSNLVTEFIKNSELKPHHIFIDMGSGIGNVVLQVASQVLCESWGVEIMEIPSTFAKAQCIEFISRMRYYGKPCGKIKLRHADFLEDPEVDRILKVADVVFVNNYAFDANLNQRILQKFLDLKENTRIISLKNFVPLDHKINYRNANSLESILRVKEYLFGHDSVSWTNEEGKYYIHRVDRSILQSFEKNMKANRVH